MYNVLRPFSKNKSWTRFFCMYTIVKMVRKTDGPSQRSVGQCLRGPYKNVGESANVRHLAHLQTTKATKWHSNSLHKKQKHCKKKKKKKENPQKVHWSDPSLEWSLPKKRNASKLRAHARNHVFIFRRFIRSRQSSGSASKLAFFEAFPLSTQTKIILVQS